MSSRDAILQRLRNRTGGELTAPECDFSVLDRPDWSLSLIHISEPTRPY